MSPSVAVRLWPVLPLLSCYALGLGFWVQALRLNGKATLTTSKGDLFPNKVISRVTEGEILLSFRDIVQSIIAPGAYALESTLRSDRHASIPFLLSPELVFEYPPSLSLPHPPSSSLAHTCLYPDITQLLESTRTPQLCPLPFWRCQLPLYWPLPCVRLQDWCPLSSVYIL